MKLISLFFTVKLRLISQPCLRLMLPYLVVCCAQEPKISITTCQISIVMERLVKEASTIGEKTRQDFVTNELYIYIFAEAGISVSINKYVSGIALKERQHIYPILLPQYLILHQGNVNISSNGNLMFSHLMALT